MGWQLRGNERYYTRSRRVGGKVTRIYVGKGPVAELAAALDATRKAERKTCADSRQALLAEIAELEALTSDIVASVMILAESTLLAAGYYRHDRGPWIRRRLHGTAKRRIEHDVGDGGTRVAADQR